MRKALIFLGLLAVLAVPAGATAKPPVPNVVCGGACDGGGGGWTGCTQQTAEHSGNLGIVYLRHYLVVSYCKVNGLIVSISIAAHGCDAGGLASCSAGPAWLTGGGQGTGYATFEAHASWIVYTSPWFTNRDTLTLSIPVG